MFTPISAIVAFLFLPLTLPNGIRLIELPPASTATAEIIVGYDEPALADLVATAGARRLLFNTYAVGEIGRAHV